MGVTVAEAFNTFLRDTVNFSGSERQQASKSQNYLREQLGAYAASHYNFPNLIDGDFLSGSFGRKTAIAPLDDIDVFMIMDGVGLTAIKNGVYVSDVVEGSSRLSSQINWDVYKGANGYISSAKVLQAFLLALDDSIYSSSKVGDAEQAVNVWLSSYGLGLDVVPAFHLTPLYGGQDYYFIPAGRGRDDWIETNPKLDAKRLQEVGGDNIAKLRDVIRMLRYWNQEKNGERLNGYHLEVQVLRILDGYTIDQRRDALVYVFGQLQAMIEAPCPSQTGFGSNVDEYLSDSDREASSLAAQLASVGAWLAKSYENMDDHAKAVESWQGVFGSTFPDS